MDLLEEWNLHSEKKEEIKKNTTGEEIFKTKLEDTARCKDCFDRGYIIKQGKASKCKSCEGLSLQADVLEKSDEEVSLTVNNLNIPEFYKAKEFTPEILKKDENLSLSVRNDVMMDYYIKQLKKVMDNFILGQKLDNSYLIMAPQGYSKSHFVYCSMIEAIKRGFSVSPYYDTGEIYKMHYSDDMKLKEVLESDLCFIKIMPAFVSKKDTQAVKYVLDKRARRNLPTIVISRFNMGYLGDIEPHLGNNFGLKNVDKGDYAKLKEILAPYTKDYTRYSDKK